MYGIIDVDSDIAKQFGFTSDKFHPLSYLWIDGNTIIISIIASKRKGAFRTLMETIVQNGYDFEIPTPLKRMREIGRKQGWRYGNRYDEEVDEEYMFLTNKEML